MGRAIADFRDEIVLVTKGGREWQRDNPDRRTATVSVSDRDTLLASIDESLQRLNTDRIDLFLIHWPDHTRPFEEPMLALEHAKSQGKVLHTGVSNFSPDMMQACREFSPIVTNQIGYHIFDRRPEAEVVPFIADNDMGIMAYGSLAHGLLTEGGVRRSLSGMRIGVLTVRTSAWHPSGRITLQLTSQSLIS